MSCVLCGQHGLADHTVLTTKAAIQIAAHIGKAVGLIMLKHSIETVLKDAMCKRQVPYDMGGTWECGGLPCWVDLPSSDFHHCYCDVEVTGEA